MIARMWKGWTRATDIDAYVDGLRERIKGQGTMPGKLGSILLSRSQGNRSEIVTLSFWDSLESVRAFAGEPIERAVFYPLDEQYLVDRETTVAHFEVVGSEGVGIPAGGSSSRTTSPRHTKPKAC
jgi:heme-degrading monooxygenase HmoA